MGFHLNIKPQILTAIIHWRYNGAALHRNLFLGMGFMEKAINDEFLKDSLLQLRLVSISCRVASYGIIPRAFLCLKIIMKPNIKNPYR